MLPYPRHVELLHAAGFTEVGLIWRGLHDAASQPFADAWST